MCNDYTRGDSPVYDGCWEVEPERRSMGMMRGHNFTVIDKKTGTYPDCEQIALKEDWAKHLIYCDIDGFYIGEEGALVLVDDCGNAAFCPADRFEIVWESSREEAEAALAAMKEQTP